MVIPARAGIAGPAVDTGATGKNTNHTTDSFFTEGRRDEEGQRKNMSKINMYWFLILTVTSHLNIILNPLLRLGAFKAQITGKPDFIFYQIIRSFSSYS